MLRSRVWRVLATLFILMNLAGAGIAAVRGEALHTAIHAVLLLLAAYLVWRFAARDVARY